MSKMDGLRAMREAKYDAARRATKSPAGSTRPRAVPTMGPTEPTATSVTPTAPEQLCGHRAMSGRTCTREQGHAAKSHRYS